MNDLTIRSSNRLRLIGELYRNPATSRAELTRLTGLSRATISTIVDELVQAGLVGEHECAADHRPRSSGRPPTLLSLVPEAAYAIGLDFGHDHIRVALCDLSGVVVYDDWSAAEVDHAPVESLDLARELVGDALREAGVSIDELLGVGMGVAAPVDPVTGELKASEILPGWRGLRPAAELEARLGVPVRLENDANVGALGEQVFGAARGVEHVIYVRVSSGIGAGLIMNGALYQGALGIAGELGHTLVDPGGVICRCGNRGCLETVATPARVAGLLESALGRPVSVPELLQLVDSGDRGACRVVTDAGEAVGTALATVVNILNPELIVVGGELVGTGPVLLDPMRAAIQRHSIGPASAAVTVVAGALGDRAEVLGAAGLILSGSPEALARRVSA